LTMDNSSAKTAAEKMKEAEMTKFAAKNIFRAPVSHYLGSAIAMWKRMSLESPARKSYLRCCCTGIKRTAS
jgi:hypothetical protein